MERISCISLAIGKHTQFPSTEPTYDDFMYMSHQNNKPFYSSSERHPHEICLKSDHRFPRNITIDRGNGMTYGMYMKMIA